MAKGNVHYAFLTLTLTPSLPPSLSLLHMVFHLKTSRWFPWALVFASICVIFYCYHSSNPKSMLESFSLPVRNGSPTAAIIFLHGLGDVGRSWSPFFEGLYRRFPHLLFTFPNAPKRPVTLNGGYKMPAWYDIVSLDDSAAEDKKGFDESAAQVSLLVQSLQAQGIPSSRILLGGFSQGGAVALYTALTLSLDLAGLVILSSYLPFARAHPYTASLPTQKYPIFFGHGSDDPVIAMKWGKQSSDRLASFGFPVQFESYPGMDHSASQKEQKDVEAFIQQTLDLQ